MARCSLVRCSPARCHRSRRAGPFAVQAPATAGARLTAPDRSMSLDPSKAPDEFATLGELSETATATQTVPFGRQPARGSRRVWGDRSRSPCVLPVPVLSQLTRGVSGVGEAAPPSPPRMCRLVRQARPILPTLALGVPAIYKQDERVFTTGGLSAIRHRRCLRAHRN